MNNKFNYIYIAGYGRSGSTLADTILSASKNAIGLGEARYFQKELNEKRKCACGECIESCNFWSSISEKYLKNKSDFFQLYLEHLIQYSKENNIEFYVDSSKSTAGSIFWVFKIMFNIQNIKLIIIKRKFSEVIKSVRRGTNNYLQYNDKEKRFRLLRATISYYLSHFFAKFLSIFNKTLYISFDELVSNPNLIILKVNAKFNLSIDYVNENWNLSHQIAGNRMKNQKSINLR